MDRVCIFIDGSNLYRSMKAQCARTDLDFGAFAQELVGSSRRLVRTYYYTAMVRDDKTRMQKQQRFLDRLRMTPYFEVRLGRLEPRGGTYVEKGVDVQIAVRLRDAAGADAESEAKRRRCRRTPCGPRHRDGVSGLCGTT